MHRRIAAILTLTLVPVAGWSAGEWHGSTPAIHRTASVPVLPSPSPVSNSSSTNEGLSTLPSPLIEEPAAGQQKDIYGNDISSAIANYKSDGSGVVLRGTLAQHRSGAAEGANDVVACPR